MIYNTLHINAQCKCDACQALFKKESLYASRAKMARIIEMEIRAMAGKQIAISKMAQNVAGQIEMYLVEEGV